MPNTTKNLNMIWVGLFFSILAISSPWFNSYISNHDFVKSYIASFGVFLLMHSALYFKSLEPDINIKLNFIKLGLFILLLFGSFSLLWSVNIDFAIGKLLLWLIAAFSFILSLNLSITHENIIKLSWGLMFAAGTIAIIGLLQYYFNPFSLTQASSPASTFGNKNMAIQPLVLIFPISIFLLFSKTTLGSKVWALVGITSLIISYILISESRAALLSIFIELFVIILYFLTSKTKILRWIDWTNNKRNAFILGILFTFILINIPHHSEWRTLIITDNIVSVSDRVISTGSILDESSLQRFQIWETAITMVIDSPLFGTGLGSFAQNLANEGYATWTINNTLRAHNDLIELTVELGLLGVITFLTTVVAIIISTIKILKKTNSEIQIFFLIIFASLTGSFTNLQFSFPYQMAFPLLLFGLYVGLISQYTDQVSNPLKTFKIPITVRYKKIILLISSTLILIIFYLTYFQWIIAYDKLDRIARTENFTQLEVIDTAVFEQKFQFMLYSLGGKYFKIGNYDQSRLLDNKFLEVWPNHLDVLYRASYAEHALGNNPVALKMAKKLKKLEPKGLYNSYIVEMFIYQNENKITKLEESFQKLLLEPEEFLKLDEDTYRLMVYFTLSSKNLSKYALELYEKYINEHGFSCEVENNIAIHYFNKEDFNMASIHVDKTKGKDQNCLNPVLVRLLTEKGLIFK
jgi:O-antigen ligase/tetratricopeptide (TPR) repeat protein